MLTKLIDAYNERERLNKASKAAHDLLWDEKDVAKRIGYDIAYREALDKWSKANSAYEELIKEHIDAKQMHI